VIQRARAAADLPVSQASQLSSISVSRSVAGVPKARWGIIVAAASLAMLLGAFVVFRFMFAAPKTVAAHADESAKVAPAPPPPPSAVDTTPIAPLAITASAPPTTPVVTPPPPTATVASGGHHRPPTNPTSAATTPPTTAPPPAKNCDPPYTLDDKGHKIWKRECM
jgi:serine/threonine-protein kinase